MLRNFTLNRFAGRGRRVLLIAALAASVFASAIAQQKTDSSETAVPIDYFEQPDLPLNIEEATFVKRSDKNRLKARITNRSDEPVGGVSFALLSFDEAGHIIGRQTWLEKLDLEPGELRAVTIRFAKNIALDKDGKLVLGVEEVFGARSIWLSEKVHNAIEAYGAGKNWQAPTVKRVTNAVDSPPQR